MQEIKTIEEAKKLLEKKRGFKVKDIKKYNWVVKDEEIDELMTDEEIINYANDQAYEVEERKQREKDRIKKVMYDRKKVADRLKKQGYTCKLEEKNINIDDVKKEVVDIIKSLKFTGQYSKEQLIERFESFTTEEFDCFADDGNTKIPPEEYYLLNDPILIFPKDKAERELQSIDTQHSFHTIDGEAGVNMLKCCSECRDLFLENTFKIIILKKLLAEEK